MRKLIVLPLIISLFSCVINPVVDTTKQQETTNKAMLEKILEEIRKEEQKSQENLGKSYLSMSFNMDESMDESMKETYKKYGFDVKAFLEPIFYVRVVLLDQVTNKKEEKKAYPSSSTVNFTNLVVGNKHKIFIEARGFKNENIIGDGQEAYFTANEGQNNVEVDLALPATPDTNKTASVDIKINLKEKTTSSPKPPSSPTPTPTNTPNPYTTPTPIVETPIPKKQCTVCGSSYEIPANQSCPIPSCTPSSTPTPIVISTQTPTPTPITYTYRILNPNTQEGKSSLNKALLKAISGIFMNTLTVSVAKIDESKFSANGKANLKVGSPEISGVNKGDTLNIQANTTKLLTYSLDLSAQDWSQGNQKDYYVRVETDGWSWVGPIKVVREQK